MKNMLIDSDELDAIAAPSATTPTCLACNVERLHELKDRLSGVVCDAILSELGTVTQNLKDLNLETMQPRRGKQ
jgi:hypothetical protein